MGNQSSRQSIPLSHSESKTDVTAGGLGVGTSLAPPFLWLRLKNPTQTWEPSWGVGVGGVVCKLHFYLKENKGIASWSLPAPSPGPVTPSPQRGRNKACRLDELGTPAPYGEGRGSVSPEWYHLQEKGRGSTFPEEPKDAREAAIILQLVVLEGKSKETSRSVQKRTVHIALHWGL